MLFFSALLSFITATTGLTITEPVDGETYDGDWLTVRAIVENGNALPDSVHYSLNGNPVTQIPRLNTDWPTYMQNYQNHGYSKSPAPHDNTILWSAPVTGTVHEFPTPVVWEGIVFYPQDNGGEDLYALDAATGEILWVFEGTGDTDDAVTISDGKLYTASDSLWCLDALTGARIWASAIGDAAGGSVIVTDGMVYCADNIIDSTVVSCLNADDGSIVWSQNLFVLTASCMAYWNGILVVPTSCLGGGIYGSLYGIDAETGEVLWENTDSDVGYWDSSPTIVDGIIYINDCSEKTFAFDLFTGEKIWEQPTGGGIATIAYHEGRLYFACEGTPYYCLDASSGNTHWTSPYCQHGSSGLADGLVFFGESGFNLDSASVVALDMETGAEVWSYRTACNPNLGFQSSPSITDGVMYYACTDGYLYAFGTGLKYTYLDDLYAQIGSNELIVTSYDGGAAVAADTISFTVTGTGINLDASHLLNLSASPNPFVSTASVSFNLSEPGFTSVDIFDLAGRRVTSLINTELAPGSHTVLWDGRDDSGVVVSSGLYLCRIQSGEISETTGLCLLR